MKHLLIHPIFLLIVTFACQSPSQKNEESLPINFIQNAFSYVIPKGWSEISDNDLKEFKVQFENNVADIAANYQGVALDYEFGVPFMAGFRSPQNEILFISYVLQMPPQPSNYLQVTLEDSQDKLKWLLDNKSITKVISNTIDTLNNKACFISEFETKDTRMATYNFFNDSVPYKVAAVNIIYNQPDQKSIQQVSEILRGLKVTIK